MRCEQFYKFKKVRDFNNRKTTLFFLQKGLYERFVILP